MPPLNPATDFRDDGGAPSWRARHANPYNAPTRRLSPAAIIAALIVLPPLALFLAAATWVLWLAARDGTGSATGAALVLAALVAVAVFLKRLGVVRSFAGGLMMIAGAGFAGLSMFVCGMVAWAFAVGG
jgi:hypothetical protein